MSVPSTASAVSSCGSSVNLITQGYQTIPDRPVTFAPRRTGQRQHRHEVDSAVTARPCSGQRTSHDRLVAELSETQLEDVGNIMTRVDKGRDETRRQVGVDKEPHAGRSRHVPQGQFSFHERARREVQRLADVLPLEVGKILEDLAATKLRRADRVVLFTSRVSRCPGAGIA